MSKSRYRIIKYKEKFQVRKRWGWFWLWYSSLHNAGCTSWWTEGSGTEYPSFEEAYEALQKKRAEDNSVTVVAEYE